MHFLCSYSGDTQISEGALLWAEQGTIGPFCPANPFGIILQKIDILVIGIGYESVQEDTNQCGGPCAFGLTTTTTNIGCLTSMKYYLQIQFQHLAHMRTVFGPCRLTTMADTA